MPVLPRAALSSQRDRWAGRSEACGYCPAGGRGAKLKSQLTLVLALNTCGARRWQNDFSHFFLQRLGADKELHNLTDKNSVSS